MKAKDLLDKSELKNKKRTIKDLVRFIQTRENQDTSNYSLFLGAGASKSSGISTASELIKEWMNELYERYNESNTAPPENLSEYFEQKHPTCTILKTPILHYLKKNLIYLLKEDDLLNSKLIKSYHL